MTSKEILAKAKLLEPLVRIGKQGITDNLIVDLKDHLKKRKMIKVKFLRAFIDGKDKKELGVTLAAACDARVVAQIGHVVVLALPSYGM